MRNLRERICCVLNIFIEQAARAQAEAEEQKELSESQKELSFTYHCSFDILTPSQVSECSNAGHRPLNGDTTCIFEEDREDMKWKFNLSHAEPLTPAERLECENAGYEPRLGEDEDTKE